MFAFSRHEQGFDAVVYFCNPKFFIAVLVEQKPGILSKMGQQQLLKFDSEFYHLFWTCD